MLCLQAWTQSSALSQRVSCITRDFFWPSAWSFLSRALLWAQRPSTCFKALWTWVSEHIPDQFWLKCIRALALHCGWATATKNKYSGACNAYWSNPGIFHTHSELKELLVAAARLQIRGWPWERQSLDIGSQKEAMCWVYLAICRQSELPCSYPLPIQSLQWILNNIMAYSNIKAYEV